MRFKCPVCGSKQYINSFILYISWLWDENHSIICTNCGYEIALNQELKITPMRRSKPNVSFD